MEFSTGTPFATKYLIMLSLVTITIKSNLYWLINLAILTFFCAHSISANFTCSNSTLKKFSRSLAVHDRTPLLRGYGPYPSIDRARLLQEDHRSLPWPLYVHVVRPGQDSLVQLFRVCSKTYAITSDLTHFSNYEEKLGFIRRGVYGIHNRYLEVDGANRQANRLNLFRLVEGRFVKTASGHAPVPLCARVV